MKRICLTILAAVIVTAAIANPKSDMTKTYKTIIVQAQGRVVKLNAKDVAYILAHSHNKLVDGALRNGMQTIRFNEAADGILAVLDARK